MGDDQAGIDLIADARERTNEAASARVELLIDHDWEMPPRLRRRQGGLIAPVISLAAAAGKRLLKSATDNFDLRHQTAEGVIDLKRRRYMLDFGSFAQLYVDGKEWYGRSGRVLSTLRPDEKELPTPLWLLDILAGITAATQQDAQDVRGQPCRCFAVTVDISRASKLTPGGVAVPSLGRFEDLLALKIEVCLDEQHVRRVRFAQERYAETLELWDLGLPVDDLDWNRLPTFRFPEEAAAVANARRRG